MKSYTITVNGNVYDVTVEENGAGAAAPAAAPRKAAAPVAAPAAPAAPRLRTTAPTQIAPKWRRSGRRSGQPSTPTLQVQVCTTTAAAMTRTAASTRSGLWSGMLVPVLGGLPSLKPTTSSGPGS